MTIKEAGDYLGVSIRTVQRYIRGKKIKAKHINGKTIILRSSLEEVKSETDIVRSVHDSPDQNQQRSNKDDHHQGFEFNLVKDSLNILRDQLRAKDDQIKELSYSVKELQTTQKLLIEKGLNLTPLSAAKENDRETSLPINETLHQNDKVVNISIAQDEQSVPIIKSAEKENKPSLENPANRNFVIAVLGASIVFIIIATIFFLLK